MRPNEEFVLEALVSKFGGQFTDGEDPPDAYLQLENKRVAVEVSRLVQQLVSENGTQRSRFKDDMPPINLANDLDQEMSDLIPDGKYIFLILSAPMKSIRKTKKTLRHIILKMLETDSKESILDIEGNSVSINIYNRPGTSGKKVAAAIINRHSSANIGNNARLLLMDRISTKNKKWEFNEEFDEYWLALYNHYWIADNDSYRSAYESIKIEHNFSKIFIVDGASEVFQLC